MGLKCVKCKGNRLYHLKLLLQVQIRQGTDPQQPTPSKESTQAEDTTLGLKQEVCAYSTALNDHFPTLLVAFVFFSAVL